MLDVRKLVVLREVARAGSITAAARNLSYTRSALSQQLSSLEADVGAHLLDRTGGRAVLTEAGLTLVEHTEQVLVELRRAGESVARDAGEVRGRLHVGAPFREGPRLMGTALAEVRRRHPRVEVALSAVTDAGADDAVRSGRLDAALSSVYDGQPVGVGGGLARLVLAEDPLELCLPRGHRLAVATTCALADLAHERWVLAGGALGALVLAAARGAGYEPDVAAAVDDLGAAASMAGLGWGVTVLPALTPADASAPLERRRLDDLAATRRIVVTVREDERARPATAALLEVLQGLGAPPAVAEPV